MRGGTSPPIPRLLHARVRPVPGVPALREAVGPVPGAAAKDPACWAGACCEGTGCCPGAAATARPAALAPLLLELRSLLLLDRRCLLLALLLALLLLRGALLGCTFLFGCLLGGTLFPGCCFLGRAFLRGTLFGGGLFPGGLLLECSFLGFAFLRGLFLHGALGEVGHGLVLLDRRGLRGGRRGAFLGLRFAIGQDAERRHVCRRVHRGALRGRHRLGHGVCRRVGNGSPGASPVGRVFRIVCRCCARAGAAGAGAADAGCRGHRMQPGQRVPRRNPGLPAVPGQPAVRAAARVQGSSRTEPERRRGRPPFGRVRREVLHAPRPHPGPGFPTRSRRRSRMGWPA